MSAVDAASLVDEPAVDDLTPWQRTAIEWRRERDRREPLKRDLEAERKALIRDFIVEALTPAARDLEVLLLSLGNDDDAGAIHHFRRFLAAVRHAEPALKELAP
jgi:hypothetical protein